MTVVSPMPEAGVSALSTGQPPGAWGPTGSGPGRRRP